jgi:hypothetical protein
LFCSTLSLSLIIFFQPQQQNKKWKSREIKSLESKIELIHKDGSQSTGGVNAEQELGNLKALLENEINERKRTTILLNMLQDHNQRLTALSEASINAAATSAKMSATGSSATTTTSEGGGSGGSLTAVVSTEYTLLQYVSYVGLLMAVIGCLWAVLSSSAAGSNSRGQPSRYRKDTSHIV